MEIVSCAHGTALARGREGPARLDVMLVGEQPPGTWVLASRGCALRVLNALEAASTGAALDALAHVLAGGTDIDAHFADLIGREPELPAHLRRTTP